MQVELDFVEAWETVNAVMEVMDRTLEQRGYQQRHGTPDLELIKTLTEKYDVLLRSRLNLEAAMRFEPREAVPA